MGHALNIYRIQVVTADGTYDGCIDRKQLDGLEHLVQQLDVSTWTQIPLVPSDSLLLETVIISPEKIKAILITQLNKEAEGGFFYRTDGVGPDWPW